MKPTLRPLLVLSALPLAACAPTVNVAVPKPVVIDVNMKVDVTSRNEAPKKGDAAKADGAEGTATDATTKATGAEGGAAEDAHLLSGEVQSLKDQRFVGEGADGYLAIRDLPAGKLSTGEDWAAYVKRVVDDENRTRRTLYARNAAKNGTSLDDEAKATAKRLAEVAYGGEWVQDDKGKWKQK
ncbi:MAG TPA: YdbL family protein [Candidatus Methylacidiphilales bacterium]